MLQFETVITTLVMTAWLLVLTALYRRFRRQAVEPLHAGLAAAAFARGLLSAIPGLLHTIAVTGSAVNNHKPYDLRLAWLLTVGLIFMYTGSVNVLLSGRIKRSERSAVVMSASSTALLVAFLAVLHPAKSQTLLIVLNGTYPRAAACPIMPAGQRVAFARWLERERHVAFCTEPSSAGSSPILAGVFVCQD